MVMISGNTLCFFNVRSVATYSIKYEIIHYIKFAPVAVDAKLRIKDAIMMF